MVTFSMKLNGTTRKQIQTAVLIILLTFSCTSKKAEEKDAGMDAMGAGDSGGDSDNDTDSDSDTDTDTDSDSDSDTDSDTDADSDAGAGAQCSGQPDFTSCQIFTNPDRSYDICIDGTCQSPGCGTEVCNSPGPHFNFHASTDRFTRDNNPGGTDQPVVQDNVTGLMWQGCARGQTGATCTGSATSSNWYMALSDCDSLSWGGFSDWRLPDPFELQSIVDYKKYDPVINKNAFSTNASSENFWTSSSYLHDTWLAWFVSFKRGNIYRFEKNDEACVRCVRLGPWPRTERFVRTVPETNEPVVLDNTTGLVWQGCEAGKTGDQTKCSAIGSAEKYTWQQALDYCQDLSWGKQTDWRIPDVKELLSIMDHRYYPSIDKAAFPLTDALYFWSSFSCSYDSAEAWYVGVPNGNVSSNIKTSEHFVLCVRAGP